jgi:capsular polysaccharide transport system permease protein
VNGFANQPHGQERQAPSQPVSQFAFHRLRDMLLQHFGPIFFWAVFFAPTLIAIIFWGLIASDRFISEAQFIVRSVETSPVGDATTFLQDIGITRANDDAFAINAYIKSRDLTKLLMKEIDLRKVYGHTEADWITRYGKTGAADTDEAFYRYFIKQVSLERDVEKGITTLSVSAYDPADAKAIADAILRAGEKRVNALNVRAQEDAVAQAQSSFGLAAQALVDANVALTQYRNTSKSVDPAASADSAQDQSSQIDQELMKLRVQLQSMVSHAVSSPAIPSLRRRIAALERQAGAQQAKMTGGSNALSGKLGGYEELIVKRELAERIFENAQKELDSAKQEAARHQIYVETIAQPNLPDDSREPRRLRYIATVALLSFWAYLMLYLLVSGAREHLNLS